jgi:TatD DNase family protein
MLIDTHCHLTHERLWEDLEGVLEDGGQAGVGAVVAVASDLDDAREISKICERGRGSHPKEPRVWGTAGIHPHEASAAPVAARERLLDTARSYPRIVALGECGLDYHYDLSPRDVQRRTFDVHIEVAQETGLPLVVHCRDAETDMKSSIIDAKAAGVRGVLHCFSGDLSLLDLALDAEWMVSFTGMVTFRMFGGAEAVRRVPEDCYMLETDGPYMAPVPFRGKRSEPAYIPMIRDRVAELRGETATKVERDSTANAQHFFGELLRS